MHKINVVLLSILLFSVQLEAQPATTGYDIEPAIEELMDLHAAAWSNVNKIDGFRIQIVALTGSNSRNSAQEVNDGFIKAFPEIPCYLSYAEPNFRVRVGNFTTRLQALQVLAAIQAIFPGAFIVKDKIYFTNF